MPYKDRLAELAGSRAFLFAGNASGAFYEKIVNPDGSEIEALGLKFTTTAICPSASTMSRWESLILAMAKSLCCRWALRCNSLTEGDNELLL